jgi:rifampin ADP-ribosylating transferase
MTSRETLNREQLGPYYHGTEVDLRPGEMVEPGRHLEHVYATSHPGWARVYSGRMRKYGGNPRVYEVRPTGPIEMDPTKGGLGAIRSTHPMRVVREHDPEQHPFTMSLDEPYGSDPLGRREQ